MPSMTRCGSPSITLRSMNAPGSPSSPLQTRTSARRRPWPPCPLQPCGIAAAAASPEAAFGDAVNHAAGRHLGQRSKERLVSVAGDVIVDFSGSMWPAFSSTTRT